MAVSADTGSLVWHARVAEPTKEPSGSTLRITHDYVLVGDYDVVAVARERGAIRWRFRPATGYGPGLYLGHPDGEIVTAGSPAGIVYAIDQETGRLRWLYRVAEGTLATVFEPVTDSDRVYAGFKEFPSPMTGGIVAIDKRSGKQLWRYLFSKGFGSGPVLAKGRLVATDGLGNLHILSATDGKERSVIRWAPFNGVFAGASPEDHRALAISGDTLFASSLTGTVVAYDLDTFQERWRYFDSRNGSAGFHISVDGSRLFVPYVGAGMVALRVSDGLEVWRTSGMFWFPWPPASDGTRIFVAGTPGVLAFE